MISVKELAERDKARKNIKKEIYKSILGQFSRKIKARFDLGDKKTVLTVPPFVVGFPRYDLAEAVRYIGRQLARLGYSVNMVAPTSYEVSWEKLSTHQTITEEVVEPEFEFPSLMNLKKTAERYK
jgi:Family of unknown function (DUF5759)